MAIVFYMGQHVGWCDWLVTQNPKYWHHIVCNIFCLNSHFLSQFMLEWSLYQHFCLSVLFIIDISELLQALIIYVYHLTLNSHDEASGLIMKCWSLSDGKLKYRWSVSRAFTVWLQAQHGAKIECTVMQDRLCDCVQQTVVCWLSVVCRYKRYWLLVFFTFVLEQYAKPYTLLYVHNCTLCTLHMHTHVYAHVAVIKLPVLPLA
jgi:hypothetical protein